MCYYRKRSYSRVQDWVRNLLMQLVICPVVHSVIHYTCLVRKAQGQQQINEQKKGISGFTEPFLQLQQTIVLLSFYEVPSSSSNSLEVRRGFLIKFVCDHCVSVSFLWGFFVPFASFYIGMFLQMSLTIVGQQFQVRCDI